MQHIYSTLHAWSVVFISTFLSLLIFCLPCTSYWSNMLTITTVPSRKAGTLILAETLRWGLLTTVGRVRSQVSQGDLWARSSTWIWLLTYFILFNFQEDFYLFCGLRHLQLSNFELSKWCKAQILCLCWLVSLIDQLSSIWKKQAGTALAKLSQIGVLDVNNLK